MKLQYKPLINVKDLDNKNYSLSDYFTPGIIILIILALSLILTGLFYV